MKNSKNKDKSLLAFLMGISVGFAGAAMLSVTFLSFPAKKAELLDLHLNDCYVFKNGLLVDYVVRLTGINDGRYILTTLNNTTISVTPEYAVYTLRSLEEVYCVGIPSRVL